MRLFLIFYSFPKLWVQSDMKTYFTRIRVVVHALNPTCPNPGEIKKIQSLHKNFLGITKKCGK